MSQTNFTLIAHRGFSSKAPENTMSAFRLAVVSNFPQIELDVQLTNDGVPIIFHDDTLERTTDGHGKVNALSLREVKQLDAGSWFSEDFVDEQIPTLEEVLRELAGIAHLHIELKSKEPELAQIVATQLHKAGIDGPLGLFVVPGITITSFLIEQLERSLQVLRNVDHSWLVPHISDEIRAAAKALGIAQLCPEASEVSTSEVRHALDDGFTVRGWGVKTDQDVIRLYEAATQGTTVNWPDRASVTLRQIV